MESIFNFPDASGSSKMSTNSHQFVHPIFAETLLTTILTCPVQITGRRTNFAPNRPCSCRIVVICLCLRSPAFIKLECSLRIHPYPFICGISWPSVYSAPISGSSGSHDCGTDGGRPSLQSPWTACSSGSTDTGRGPSTNLHYQHSPFSSLLCNLEITSRSSTNRLENCENFAILRSLTDSSLRRLVAKGRLYPSRNCSFCITSS